MNLNWKLDGLFSSFESKKFKSELKKCEELSNDFNNYVKKLLESNKTSTEKIEDYFKNSIESIKVFSPVGNFAHLSFSTNSSNTDALSVLQKLQNFEAKTVSGTVIFEKWIASLNDVDKIINKSEFLKEHKYLIKEIIKKSNYSLDEKTESIIASLRTSGSLAWDTLQKKTSSSITVNINIDGKLKEMPLQAVRNLAFEADPIKRKLGYEAEMKAYKIHEEVSAASLNGIKGESLTLSKLRGYKSPLEQTLIKSKMDKETLDAMLSAMKDSMNKFREYFKTKAKLLNHKNGLPFYDLFAPMGKGELTFTFDEGREFVLEQFKSFSTELHDFAVKAFDNGWIDVEPKKGKSSGAFCAGLHTLKESRILLNYTGKLNNVITLAHELGHGFHNYNMYDNSILNIGSPMPLAETASIFCETIVKNAALEKADDKTAFSILEVAIQGYSQVIIDIYSRFLFESKLFEKRANVPLSPSEICELMIEAQKESYGDGLDPEVLHPYMWMNKIHYYIPDMDFYNFPYAFGLLFAKGLYAKYKDQGEEFIGKLNNLLSSTGVMDIAECAQLLDVDVRSKDFWAASLNEIEIEIDKFINLSKNI